MSSYIHPIACPAKKSLFRHPMENVNLTNFNSRDPEINIAFRQNLGNNLTDDILGSPEWFVYDYMSERNTNLIDHIDDFSIPSRDIEIISRLTHSFFDVINQYRSTINDLLEKQGITGEMKEQTIESLDQKILPCTKEFNYGIKELGKFVNFRITETILNYRKFDVDNEKYQPLITSAMDSLTRGERVTMKQMEESDCTIQKRSRDPTRFSKPFHPVVHNEWWCEDQLEEIDCELDNGTHFEVNPDCTLKVLKNNERMLYSSDTVHSDKIYVNGVDAKSLRKINPSDNAFKVNGRFQFSDDLWYKIFERKVEE